MITLPTLTALMMLTITFGPLDINSGYRTAKHNKKVGGVANSRHIQGKAFDIGTHNLSKEQKKDLIAKAKVVFDVVISYKNHIHIHIK